MRGDMDMNEQEAVAAIYSSRADLYIIQLRPKRKKEPSKKEFLAVPPWINITVLANSPDDATKKAMDYAAKNSKLNGFEFDSLGIIGKHTDADGVFERN